MHPRYKMEYFRRLKWPAPWIQTAEEIIREQWESHYKKLPDSNEDVDSQAQSQSQSSAAGKVCSTLIMST